MAMRFFIILLLLAAGILLLAYLRRGSTAGDKAELVFRDSQGREATEKDLARANGEYDWSIVGSEVVSQRARELHEEGRRAGSDGDSPRALLLFAQAAKEAPLWPYPPYDAAFTYLLNGDLEQAERHYTTVERLAPRGYFTYLTELDCIRRERAGEFAAGTCRAYVTIADMPVSPDKRAALEQLVRQSPTLAPAWAKLASTLNEDDAKMRAIDKGLTCMPDGETRGYLLLNRAMILNRQGKRDEAVGILKGLVADPQSPLDVELNAKFSLSHLS